MRHTWWRLTHPRRHRQAVKRVTERPNPCCIECFGAPAIQVLLPSGIPVWYCAEDWEAVQRVHAGLMKFLADGAANLRDAQEAP